MSRPVRVLLLYNGPDRLRRVLAWVYFISFTLMIALPLIAGDPPTWLTVFGAIFAVSIAEEMIKFYQVKRYFEGDAVSSIAMTKIDALPDSERVSVR